LVAVANLANTFVKANVKLTTLVVDLSGNKITDPTKFTVAIAAAPSTLISASYNLTGCTLAGGATTLKDLATVNLMSYKLVASGTGITANTLATIVDGPAAKLRILDISLTFTGLADLSALKTSISKLT